MVLWRRRAGPPAGVSFKAKNPSSSRILGSYEKLQLIKRLPAPFIRHLLASHRAGQLSAKAAAAAQAAQATDSSPMYMWKYP